MSNKIKRKQRRSQVKILEDLGIQCNLTPAKNIFISNAGLSNGITQEMLLELFTQYAIVNEIIMLPGKSYSFIRLNSVEESLRAFKYINGVSKIGPNTRPLYLLFAEKVPEVTSIWDITKIPSGLFVIEEFVTQDEEKILINCIGWETKSDCESKNLKNRQVKHYGYEFRYDINNVDKDKPLVEAIPKECDFIKVRLQQYDYNLKFDPDQLTVNRYYPGQGIPSHIDTHDAFEDYIFSLSLCSSVVMEFRHRDGRHVAINLPRRSLLIMSGEARYDWSHGITPRVIDVIPAEKGLTARNREVRISFTFRNILRNDCCCLFKEECETFKQNKKSISTLENNSALLLENMHVHDVYEQIASHFSDTRHKPWPNVLEFVISFDIGSILIDVGCGNGKYFGYNHNIIELGCDRSFNLLQFGQSQGFQTFKCDCLSIPLRDNIADGLISIAVIHHLASEERRLQAIQEIVRVLKVGGRALIYVWAKNQIKNFQKSNYLRDKIKINLRESSQQSEKNRNLVVGETNLVLPVHENRTEFEYPDVLVPWKLKDRKKVSDENKTFLRYYHVFDENELHNLCETVNNISILKSYYDQGNWCIQIKKVENCLQ